MGQAYSLLSFRPGEASPTAPSSTQAAGSQQEQMPDIDQEQASAEAMNTTGTSAVSFAKGEDLGPAGICPSSYEFTFEAPVARDSFESTVAELQSQTDAQFGPAFHAAWGRVTAGGDDDSDSSSSASSMIVDDEEFVPEFLLLDRRDSLSMSRDRLVRPCERCVTDTLAGPDADDNEDEDVWFDACERLAGKDGGADAVVVKHGIDTSCSRANSSLESLDVTLQRLPEHRGHVLGDPAPDEKGPRPQTDNFPHWATALEDEDSASPTSTSSCSSTSTSASSLSTLSPSRWSSRSSDTQAFRNMVWAQTNKRTDADSPSSSSSSAAPRTPPPCLDPYLTYAPPQTCRNSPIVKLNMAEYAAMCGLQSFDESPSHSRIRTRTASRRVRFSPTASMITHAPDDVTARSTSSTQLCASTSPNCSLPSLTITPPSPLPPLSPYSRAQLHNHRDGTRQDPSRLAVREGDRSLNRRERASAAVHDRWQIVNRRRQRFQDALSRRVGKVEAYMRARAGETKKWDDWAWGTEGAK